MAKLDYDEQFEETEEEIRARDAKERKITPEKVSGRSVFESQRLMREKSQNPEPSTDKQENT